MEFAAFPSGAAAPPRQPLGRKAAPLLLALSSLPAAFVLLQGISAKEQLLAARAGAADLLMPCGLRAE